MIGDGVSWAFRAPALRLGGDVRPGTCSGGRDGVQEFIHLAASLATKTDGAMRHIKLVRAVVIETCDLEKHVELEKFITQLRTITSWLQPGYRIAKGVDQLSYTQRCTDQWQVIHQFQWICPLILLATSAAQLVGTAERQLGVLTSRGYDGLWFRTGVVRRASLVSSVSAMTFAAIKTSHWYVLGEHDAKYKTQGHREVWNFLKFSCDVARILAEMYLTKKISNRISIVSSLCGIVVTWKDLYEKRNAPAG